MPSGLPAPSSPFARQQAVSVLARRQAMVIGPTPPRTGVMAPATSAAGIMHIAYQLGLAVALDPVDAHVDHGRAGFHHVAGDHLRAANGSRRISAPRQTAARSLVRLCAMVTVQLSPNSNCAIGLPTMFERPTTTAFSPASLPW